MFVLIFQVYACVCNGDERIVFFVEFIISREHSLELFDILEVTLRYVPPPVPPYNRPAVGCLPSYEHLQTTTKLFKTNGLRRRIAAGKRVMSYLLLFTPS